MNQFGTILVFDVQVRRLRKDENGRVKRKSENSTVVQITHMIFATGLSSRSKIPRWSCKVILEGVSLLQQNRSISRILAAENIASHRHMNTLGALHVFDVFCLRGRN